MHPSLNGRIKLPFIYSDLLYIGVLYGKFDCINITQRSDKILSV